jgi:hypothetical protein
MLKLNTALAAVAIAIAVTLGFAHSAKAGATIYKSMPCSVSYAGNDYTGAARPARDDEYPGSRAAADQQCRQRHFGQPLARRTHPLTAPHGAGHKATGPGLTSPGPFTLLKSSYGQTG